MDIHEIRLQNLERLIKDSGLSAAKFAEKIGISASQLSQTRSDKYKRNVGTNAARNFETALNLPHGWMDQRHDVEAMPTDEQLAALISVATETYMESLVTIQKAKEKGILEESDKKLVKVIAEKYKDRLE